MIEEAYVSFETAELLKERGFRECSTSYISEDGDIFPTPLVKRKGYYPAPTQQMAMRWLREVHHLLINIVWTGYEGLFSWDVDNMENGYCTNIDEEDQSYEEAIEAALKYCLTNLI